VSCISQLARQQTQQKATSAARASAKLHIHQLAATKFHKTISSSANWHTDKALKTAIAEYLTTQIQRSDVMRPIYFARQRNGITGKWVAEAKNW
jgi:hypothetical protein